MTQTEAKPQQQTQHFAILETALRSIHIIIKIGLALWTADEMGVFKALGF